MRQYGLAEQPPNLSLVLECRLDKFRRFNQHKPGLLEFLVCHYDTSLRPLADRFGRLLDDYNAS